jgi:ABC-type antimicrobial peptide transport system permease subunit
MSRPAARWAAIILYAVVGTAGLPGLVHLLNDPSDVGLLPIVYSVLWSVLPIAIAIGLRSGKRWAWWAGLLLPATTLGGAVLVVMLVTLAGALLPAIHAVRTNPLVAMRAE